jgi:hypothetical protein
MPVRPYKTVSSPDQTRLTAALEKEWRTPNPAVQEPVVLEESDSKGNVVHIYVIWSDWANLSRETRGETIMDAAERVKSVPEVLNITIAMGLTPEEADRFNIKWQ